MHLVLFRTCKVLTTLVCCLRDAASLVCGEHVYDKHIIGTAIHIHYCYRNGKGRRGRELRVKWPEVSIILLMLLLCVHDELCV